MRIVDKPHLLANIRCPTIITINHPQPSYHYWQLLLQTTEAKMSTPEVALPKFFQDTQTKVRQQKEEEPATPTVIRQLHIFDKNNGKLSVPAFVDSSSPSSWISQELQHHTQLRQHTIKAPNVFTFGGQELQATGTLKATWKKET